MESRIRDGLEEDGRKEERRKKKNTGFGTKCRSAAPANRALQSGVGDGTNESAPDSSWG